MTHVLVVAASNPNREALLSALERLAPAGATVDVALTRNRPQDLKGLAVHETHVMKVPRAGMRSGLPRSVVSPRWWRGLGRAVAWRVVNRRGDLPLRAWYGARWDPWVARSAGRADVLVALDRHAVYAVWRLRRRYPGARALHGLDAAVRVVESSGAAATLRA
jgi:hypothetical protein